MKAAPRDDILLPAGSSSCWPWPPGAFCFTTGIWVTIFVACTVYATWDFFSAASTRTRRPTTNHRPRTTERQMVRAVTPCNASISRASV